jgi:hypothetical protein
MPKMPKYVSLINVTGKGIGAATKFLLNLGAQENFWTQTMRAFDASEMSRIVSG